MSLSPSRLDYLRLIYIVGGFFSLVGSLIILISFLSLKELRQRQLMHLVFFMALCDLLFTLKFFIPAVAGALEENRHQQQNEKIDQFCLAQSIIHQFFGLSSISWYFCISLNAFFVLFAHNQSTSLIHSGKLTAAYHCLVWGFSLTTTLIANSAKAFGNSDDGTCWITAASQSYRLLFTAPLSLYMVLALLLLCMVIHRRAQLSFSGPNAVFSRMLAFVSVFLITWSPTLVMRFYELDANPSEIPFPLILIHSVSVSIQGFANMCIWISAPVFDRLFLVCYKKSRCLTAFLCFFHPLIWSGQARALLELQESTETQRGSTSSPPQSASGLHSPALLADGRWGASDSPSHGPTEDFLNPVMDPLGEPLMMAVDSPSRKGEQPGIPFSLNTQGYSSSFAIRQSPGGHGSSHFHQNQNYQNPSLPPARGSGLTNAVQPYGSPELEPYMKKIPGGSLPSNNTVKGSSYSYAPPDSGKPKQSGISLQNATPFFLQYPQDIPGNPSIPFTAAAYNENSSNTPAARNSLPSSAGPSPRHSLSGFSRSSSIVRAKSRSIHANPRNLLALPQAPMSPDRLTLSAALLESESGNLLDAQLPIPPTNYFQQQQQNAGRVQESPQKRPREAREFHQPPPPNPPSNS